MTSPSTLRLLLVDENELVLDSFLTIAKFAFPEWEIRIATSHTAGFIAASEFLPHIICADIGRAPKPGLTFAHKVRTDARLRNTFLIAITGWGDATTIKQINDAGFDVQLTKPVTYEDFTQHIRAFALTRSLST